MVEMCACSNYEAEAVPFHVHVPAQGAYSALHPIKDHRFWHPEPDAEWREIEVPVRKLDTLLHLHGFPRLDFLAIDVEGEEMNVLRGADLDHWKPRVIITESWDAPLEQQSYLKPFGYLLFHRHQVNNIFLR